MKKKSVKNFVIILEKEFLNKKREREETKRTKNAKEANKVNRLKNKSCKREKVKITSKLIESNPKKRSNQITKASELLEDTLLFNLEKSKYNLSVNEEREISIKEWETEFSVSAVDDPKIFMNLHFPNVYQIPSKPGENNLELKSPIINTKNSINNFKSNFKLYLNFSNEEINSDISSNIKPRKIWSPIVDTSDNDCI